jgi:hypothetical protein
VSDTGTFWGVVEREGSARRTELRAAGGQLLRDREDRFEGVGGRPDVRLDEGPVSTRSHGGLVGPRTGVALRRLARGVEDPVDEDADGPLCGVDREVRSEHRNVVRRAEDTANTRLDRARGPLEHEFRPEQEGAAVKLETTLSPGRQRLHEEPRTCVAALLPRRLLLHSDAEHFGTQVSREYEHAVVRESAVDELREGSGVTVRRLTQDHLGGAVTIVFCDLRSAVTTADLISADTGEGEGVGEEDPTPLNEPRIFLRSIRGGQRQDHLLQRITDVGREISHTSLPCSEFFG